MDQTTLTELPQIFLPHGMCLLWKPFWLLLYGSSDTLICVAYVVISSGLVRMIYWRGGVPYEPRLSRVYLWSGGFIFLCAMTHLFDVVTLWIPVYLVFGWLKFATALISLYVAFVIGPGMPGLIQGVANRMRGLESDRGLLLERIKGTLPELYDDVRSLLHAQEQVLHPEDEEGGRLLEEQARKLRAILEELNSLVAAGPLPPPEEILAAKREA